MSLAFPTETEQLPPERTPRLKLDESDATLVAGVVVGALSLGAIWLPLGGVFLAVALIVYGWRIG